MKPVRVFVVEDQGMFRTFLVQCLEETGDFTVVGAFESGEEALTELRSLKPDLLLVDLQLPGIDGLGFLSRAKILLPDVRALVLSSLDDPLALTRVRESGAHGYLEKNAPPAELLAAAREVAVGRTSYSKRFHEALGRERSGPQSFGKILSRREQEVLSHVVAGRTNKEIAGFIGLSARTVEFHRSNLMRKLAAENVADLISKVRRL